MQDVILGDCLDILPTLPEKFASLIYIDPPFNTGKVQKRNRISCKQISEDSGQIKAESLASYTDDYWDFEEFSVSRITGKVQNRIDCKQDKGHVTGFGGRRYKVEKVESSASYTDDYWDFEEFLITRIKLSFRCLKDNGSIFVHLDSNEVHYIKVALDKLLGRDHFINEIIWSYDYGGRSKRRWPEKHDTILWYALNPNDYIFNFDEIDRIPYLAPGLVGAEKAERGKTPTDVWWNTIVPTNGGEKTGYPTQKPIAILNRIIMVHSMPGDVVLDFFAGSGTTGAAAEQNGRGFVLIDQNPEAISIINKRIFLK